MAAADAEELFRSEIKQCLRAVGFLFTWPAVLYFSPCTMHLPL